MKKANDPVIGISNIKLNIFKQLKLFDCDKINKIFDKRLSICNKLTKELSKINSFDKANFKPNNQEMEIDKFILKKIKLFKKKKIQFNNKFNRTYTKIFLKKNKNSFSLEKINKKTINTKRKENQIDKNDIKKINNKLFNKVINKNISENSDILKNTSLSLSYNDNINKYQQDKNYRSIFNVKIGKNNLRKRTMIYSYKNKLKDISNEKISELINKSNTLYKSQIFKLRERKKYNSSRYTKKNFEDIEKININKNDITKSAKASKKNLDIINDDNSSKIENLDINKTNKELVSNYPFLNQISNKKFFKRNYKKISYNFHKNFFERYIKLKNAD